MTSVKNEIEMQAIGEHLGRQLRGGEVLELVGDVGTGKTTLVKGIGRGLAINEAIQSPSFTISRVYPVRNGLELHHYDFYRLQEAGIMSHEFAESIKDPRVITVVEWSETVSEVLPNERVVIRLSYHAKDKGREIEVVLPEEYQYLGGIA